MILLPLICRDAEPACKNHCNDFQPRCSSTPASTIENHKYLHRIILLISLLAVFAIYPVYPADAQAQTKEKIEGENPPAAPSSDGGNFIRSIQESVEKDMADETEAVTGRKAIPPDKSETAETVEQDYGVGMPAISPKEETIHWSEQLLLDAINREIEAAIGEKRLETPLIEPVFMIESLQPEPVEQVETSEHMEPVAAGPETEPSPEKPGPAPETVTPAEQLRPEIEIVEKKPVPVDGTVKQPEQQPIREEEPPSHGPTAEKPTKTQAPPGKTPSPEPHELIAEPPPSPAEPVAKAETTREPVMEIPEIPTEPMEKIAGQPEGETGIERVEEIPGTGEPEKEEQEYSIVRKAPEDEEKERESEKKARVELKGFRYIKYRSYNASGSETSFLSRGGLYTRNQRIEQGTNLKVTADVGDRTKVTGSFVEMPDQDRDMLFKLAHGLYAVTYGNFNAKFRGGRLSPFSKNIDGMQFDYKSTDTSIMFLTSTSKSQTKTISFSGRNIKGPYDLNERDLVPESITVKLNDQVLSPSEYILEPFMGEITFFEILGPDDTVTVTFEKRLTGILSEGTLSGLSVEREFMNDTVTLGFSHLMKDANRATQRIVESVTNETPYVDPANRQRIIVGGGTGTSLLLIVRDDYTSGSETITRQGSSDPLEPNDDYNIASEVGLGDIYENYAHGVFILKEPVPAGQESTVKVSYSYYPDSVTQCYGEADKLELVPDQSGQPYGYLEAGRTSGTIYYGSEAIFLCDDAEMNDCDITPLEREVDYTVEEYLNRVRFFPSSDFTTAASIRIETCTYPNVNISNSEYDHEVQDFRIRYDPGGKFDLEIEQARSNADISSKPISVINSVVRPAGDELDCTSQLTPKLCTFSLADQDIVDNSLVLYLDDRISTENIIARGDYILDPTTGDIEIITVIPADRALKADYNYNPPFIGVTSGERTSFRGAYEGDATKFSLEMRTGDTFFTPIGGESNLETSRLNLSLTQKVSDRVDIVANMLDVDTAMDILETHTKTSSQRGFQLSYKPRFLKSFRYQMEKRDVSDDYSPSQTDTTENKNSISLSTELPMLRKAEMKLTLASASQTDNTQANTGRDTAKRVIGFDYEPAQNLKFDSQFTLNEIDSRSPGSSFTSTNRARKIGARWLPIDLVQLAVDLDQQETSDSRRPDDTSVIHKTRIGLNTKPYGRFKSFSFVFSRQDRPSTTAPSSSSQSTSYNLGYRVSKSVSFAPKLVISKSSIGSNSSSETTTRTYNFEYRPPGAPYYATIALDRSETQSLKSSGVSTSENSGWNTVLGYTPDKVWAYSLRLKNQSRSSSRGASYDTTTFDLKVNRKIEKGSQWLILQRVTKGGTTDESDLNFELGTELKLSELLSFDIFYRLSKYNSSQQEDKNFTGHLIESTLRADF